MASGPARILPLEKRQAFTLRRANPVGALVFGSHPELFRLASIQFIGYIAHEVFKSGRFKFFAMPGEKE